MDFTCKGSSARALWIISRILISSFAQSGFSLLRFNSHSDLFWFKYVLNDGEYECIHRWVFVVVFRFQTFSLVLSMTYVWVSSSVWNKQTNEQQQQRQRQDESRSRDPYWHQLILPEIDDHGCGRWDFVCTRWCCWSRWPGSIPTAHPDHSVKCQTTSACQLITILGSKQLRGSHRYIITTPGLLRTIIRPNMEMYMPSRQQVLERGGCWLLNDSRNWLRCNLLFVRCRLCCAVVMLCWFNTTNPIIKLVV